MTKILVLDLFYSIIFFADLCKTLFSLSVQSSFDKRERGFWVRCLILQEISGVLTKWLWGFEKLSNSFLENVLKRL